MSRYFYTCGHDATLDIGTATEVAALLSVFREEGQKMARRSVSDDDREQRGI